MFWLNTKRVLRSGLVNFWRTPAVSLASVVTITVALYVGGALFLAAALLNSSLAELKEKVDVSVAFRPDASETDVLNLKQSLAALSEVSEVTYSSREAEHQAFRERNAGNELILQSLDEVGNPFGARLNIKAVDPGRYDSVVRFLTSDQALSASGKMLIDQVSFKKNIIDKLVRLIATARTVGLAVTLVLVFLSLAVAFNTISLAIYTSREEISLMKLVGAGDPYVRGPFVVQGAISGVIATILALIFLYPSVIWARNVTAGVFGGVNLVAYFTNNFGRLLLLLLASGLFLGVAASALAIRRHLKV